MATWLVVKWPARFPELRTNSRLQLHGQVAIPGYPSDHFLAHLWGGGLSRFKKINSSLLMMEDHKRSILAEIGPTPREEWGIFGQGSKVEKVPMCTSLLPATEAGPWASALPASSLATISPS